MQIVIAEDLFLLRDGLPRMLEAHGLEVAAAVGNPDDLLAARREVPGLAVLVLRSAARC